MEGNTRIPLPGAHFRLPPVLGVLPAALLVFAVWAFSGFLRPALSSAPDGGATPSLPATASPSPTLVSDPTGTPAPTNTPAPVRPTVPAGFIRTSPSRVFPGIPTSVTEQWVFPLPQATGTPAIGAFGAARTSRRIHAGIDLYAPDGTDVVAMTSGRVREIMNFYEDLLDIEVANDDGTMLRYCELTPLVSVGDRVARGQVIGRLRANSTGACMLHLEVFATDAPEALTQVGNRTDYRHVPVGQAAYMRRSDLVDPSAVYSLEGWIP